jgi:SAM-dependent methyltransferase
MVENYSALAEIYSFVMKKVRYDRWSEYLFYLTRDYLPENPRILELAAGNCSMTNLFYKHHKNIIATDLSSEMLFSSDCKVPMVCCNMLSLPFKTEFDLVFAAFDSINYLTTRKKLLIMFREVASVLSENGIFTFDASMERNSIIHAGEPLRTGIHKEIFFQHRSNYNKVTRIHTNTFIIKNSEGRTFKEIHRQKIYPFETYFEIIPQSGLYVVECYKAFSFSKGNSNSERLQFILKKAGKDAVIS